MACILLSLHCDLYVPKQALTERSTHFLITLDAVVLCEVSANLRYLPQTTNGSERQFLYISINSFLMRPSPRWASFVTAQEKTRYSHFFFFLFFLENQFSAELISIKREEQYAENKTPLPETDDILSPFGKSDFSMKQHGLHL